MTQAQEKYVTAERVANALRRHFAEQNVELEILDASVTHQGHDSKTVRLWKGHASQEFTLRVVGAGIRGVLSGSIDAGLKIYPADHQKKSRTIYHRDLRDGSPTTLGVQSAADQRFAQAIAEYLQS